MRWSWGEDDRGHTVNLEFSAVLSYAEPNNGKLKIRGVTPLFCTERLGSQHES